MTHEVKILVELIWNAQKKGVKSVIATVVELEGSSYRRPGVRMLIQDNGKTYGAVSGGCVEKEIQIQANSVFRNKIPKMIKYDGRLRLGCEGIIYILIEPVIITNELNENFKIVFKNRIPFESVSFYSITEEENKEFGTEFIFSDKIFSLNRNFSHSKKTKSFQQKFNPLFQLYIFGAEHDTVHLCKAASKLGWQVTIIAPPDESKTEKYFEGAYKFLTPPYEKIDTNPIDSHTAVILMTHSLIKDLKYLLSLSDVKPAYLGILGPQNRRENIIEKALDFNPNLSIEFINLIRGPAGLNIGAESAEEISVSILAEILSVIRKQKPIHLKEKSGRIHD